LIRRSRDIFVLALLFSAAAYGLHKMEFWSRVGLPEPHGYVWEGCLFLGLLWILQTALFDPYLKAVEAREEQTVGKRALAENTRARAEEMANGYHRSVEAGRMQGAQDREREGLRAEADERLLVAAAKKKHREHVDAALSELAREEMRVTKELTGSVGGLADDLVRKVLRRP
jgi:F0F1-type ATP synthase membrane subunit b/b'